MNDEVCRYRRIRVDYDARSESLDEWSHRLNSDGTIQELALIEVGYNPDDGGFWYARIAERAYTGDYPSGLGCDPVDAVRSLWDGMAACWANRIARKALDEERAEL